MRIILPPPLLEISQARTSMSDLVACCSCNATWKSMLHNVLCKGTGSLQMLKRIVGKIPTWAARLHTELGTLQGLASQTPSYRYLP